jgi:O-acetyl-ADP-ribose deacetylase (regulator of RNase III)
VGPVFSRREDRSAILASCYRRSLAVAEELGARTLALPAVSAGAYGWPAEDAARIAVSAVRSARTGLAEARFVLFTPAMHAVFERELSRAGSGG